MYRYGPAFTTLSHRCVLALHLRLCFIFPCRAQFLAGSADPVRHIPPYGKAYFQRSRNHVSATLKDLCRILHVSKYFVENPTTSPKSSALASKLNRCYSPKEILGSRCHIRREWSRHSGIGSESRPVETLNGGHGRKKNATNPNGAHAHLVFRLCVRFGLKPQSHSLTAT